MAVLRAPGPVRGACSHLGRAHHRRQELRSPPVLGAHRQPHHDSRGVDVALPAWRRGGVAAGQDCAARAGQRVHRFHRLYRRSLRTPVSLCDRRPRRHTRWVGAVARRAYYRCCQPLMHRALLVPAPFSQPSTCRLASSACWTSSFPACSPAASACRTSTSRASPGSARLGMRHCATRLTAIHPTPDVWRQARTDAGTALVAVRERPGALAWAQAPGKTHVGHATGTLLQWVAQPPPPPRDSPRAYAHHRIA